MRGSLYWDILRGFRVQNNREQVEYEVEAWFTQGINSISWRSLKTYKGTRGEYM